MIVGIKRYKKLFLICIFRSVEFDPTGNYIVSSSFDSTICVYDINNRNLINTLKNHTDRVVLSKFHPYYPLILSTSADCTSRLFAPRDFIISFRLNKINYKE